MEMLICHVQKKLFASSTNSSNYSWVNDDWHYWTMSYYTSNYYAWYLNSGRLGNNFFSYWGSQANWLNLRPVISLNSNVEFNEGNGTSTNPYIPSLVD